MEKEIRVCDHCGEEIVDNDYEVVDVQILCRDCIEEHCTTCDHCSETIWVNDSVQDDNITLCQTCYDDHYHRCECCGRIIYDNSTNWQGDMPYCDSCYDEFNDEIDEYSYKPEPVFYGDGKRFLGVELEVDCGGKDDDNASKLKRIANTRYDHTYIKSDGSIDDGFEIVSHPMTLEYHMNDIDWEAILHEAIKMGYRSHQTSTCGLHIHVNRNAFGDNQAEQEEVIGKMLFLIEKHWN